MTPRLEREKPTAHSRGERASRCHRRVVRVVWKYRFTHRLAFRFGVDGAVAERARQRVSEGPRLHVIGVGYQRTVSLPIALQADLEPYTPWTQNINFLGLSGEANR